MAHTFKTPERGTPARPSHQEIAWVPKEIRRVGSVLCVVARGKGRKASKERVPTIGFRGDWLRKAGFPIDARIAIVLEAPGRIVIERF